MKKRIISYFMVMAIVLSGLSFNAYAVKAEEVLEVYVATDGKADAAGTIEDPYATIEQARDYLRTKTVDAQHPATIYIRQGIYQTSAQDPTVELTSEDAYLTVSAYNNEIVRISGTVSLQNDHFKKLDEVSGDAYSSSVRLSESMKSKVYVYDLGSESISVGSINKNGFNWPKQPFTPELIVDGAIQTLAKYPNSGVMTMSNILCGKTKDGKNEDQTAKAAGANEGERPRNYIFDKTDTPKTYEEMLIMKAPIFYCRGGLEERIPAWAPPTQEGEPQNDQVLPNVLADNTKYETDGWLSGYFENNYANEMSLIYSVNSEKQTINCKYPSLQGVQDKRIQLTAINLLCELDTAGEYYIDRYNNNDILYYYPQGGTIGTKDITLTSSTAPFFDLKNTNNITIKGLVMDGSTGYGITMMNCESCSVEDCELFNISLDAVRIGKNNDKMTTDPQYAYEGGGHNNVVSNCLIHDMGCGGVYCSGGDEKTLERADNVVKNCEFYALSRLQTYTPAVYMEGVGNIATGNYIHDCPHMVIQIMGNDMQVKGNIIDNVVTNTSDQAAIYSGRNFTWLGNEISYNIFNNIKSGDYAVYMDDGMSGMLIHHNFFYNIGGSSIFSNSGFGHQIHDNVFANVASGAYYKRYSGGRPIANEKILQYRYYRIFRAADSVAEFDNTQSNIDSIYDHYKDLYPYLADRILPGTDDSTWTTNVNSLFVPNYQILNHSIFINGGNKNITNDVKSIQDSDFDTDNFVSATNLTQLGMNPDTAIISEDSPLASSNEYGQDWINEWNKGWNTASVGSGIEEFTKHAITEPTNKEYLKNLKPSENPIESEKPDFTSEPEATPEMSESGAWGDVNNDKSVNAMDALEILRYAAKIVQFSAAELHSGDVNADDSVNAIDALYILKYAAKLVGILNADISDLYASAVIDAAYADPDEIESLVTISKEDNMCSIDSSGEKVLLLTWHQYPDSYKEESEVELKYGAVWTFTDKEIADWYKKNGEGVSDWELRLEQLLGLPTSAEYTHITAMWTDIDDVVRPAVVTDVNKQVTEKDLHDYSFTKKYDTWYKNNIIDSYFEGAYPWTRLGYTYDWADNGTEYGLSEFLIEEDSKVEVEFTKTTEEFIDWLQAGGSL